MIDLIAAAYMYYSVSITDPDVQGKGQAIFPPEITRQVHDQARIDGQMTLISRDYMAAISKFGYKKHDYDDEDLNIRSAIEHFQSDCNIDVNGIWSEACLAAAKKRIADGRMVFSDIVASPASDGQWIVINKSKRIFTMYRNKAVAYKYPVAVGNPSPLTPSGKYTIVCKAVNPEWGGGGYTKPVKGGIPENPLGYRWMGLSLEGGDRYGIHGNNVPYSIGTYASHGCVRMFNPDVEALYDIITINTPVWIGDEGELEKWGIKQPELK